MQYNFNSLHKTKSSPLS